MRQAVLLVLPALLMVSVRAALPTLFPAVESVPDYRSAYLPLAQSIADGNGLVGKDGRVPDLYPPGYAYLLAGLIWISRWFGLALPHLILGLNYLCFTVVAWLLYVSAWKVFGQSAAWFSFLLWVTYPPAWFAAHVALTELPFCVMFYAIVMILLLVFDGSIRPVAGSLAAGALIGLASLLRPAGIGLGLVSSVCLLLLANWGGWRKRLLCAGLLIAANLLAVTPWLTTVYRHNHRLIPLSTGGPGSMTDGMKLARVSSWPGIENFPDALAVSQHIQDHFPELTSSGAIFTLLAEQLRANPAGVIQLFLYRAARAWYASDSGTHDGTLFQLQLLYLAVVGWATIIILRKGRGGKCLCIAAWVFTLYFWAMTTLVLSILRYMLPAMGLLFLLPPALLASGGKPVEERVPRERSGAKPLF